MKFSIGAAALVSLLPFVVAAPFTARVYHKRAEVCDFTQVSGGVSITTSDDNSGKIRWDLFSEAGEGIQDGQLAWFQEDQPDQPATFIAVGSTDGNTLFSFQRQPDFQQVVASSSGFSAQSSGGTEFNVTCNGACNTGAGGTQLVADGCTMELTNGGTGTGQCVDYIGGTVTPVTIAPCDSSLSQTVAFFAV